eukprot:s1268_g3.t1
MVVSSQVARQVSTSAIGSFAAFCSYIGVCHYALNPGSPSLVSPSEGKCVLLAAVPVTATMLLLLQSRALSGMLSGQRPEFLEADVDQMPILITALDRLERKMIHLEQMSETILVKAPTSSAGSGSSGPSLDPESLARVERRSEDSYWFQRKELNQVPSPHFAGLEPNWPCLWGEEQIGVAGGDGNKWMCGARLLQTPCVVYSFSFGDFAFEKGAMNLAKGCEIHVHDPTTDGSQFQENMHWHFHKVGIADYDGLFKLGRGTWHLTRLEGMPVKTLATLMQEHGHKHIDALKIDIEGIEYQVLTNLNTSGWPSIGQLMVEVHVQKDERYRRWLLKLVEQIESAGFRLFHKETNVLAPQGCIEYAFIQRGWRPETKAYDMYAQSSPP